MSYTPHEIAHALRNQELESEDLELHLDLGMALTSMEEPHKSILLLYSADVSPGEALKSLGLKGNPQRMFNRALGLLVGTLNGSEVSVVDSRGVHSPLNLTLQVQQLVKGGEHD